MDKYQLKTLEGKIRNAIKDDQQASRALDELIEDILASWPAPPTDQSAKPTKECGKSTHVCGVMGFNPILGDYCEACYQRDKK